MPNHTIPSLSSQMKINNTKRSEISPQVYTKYEHFIAPKQLLIFFSFPEKKPPILNLNNQKSNKTAANKQTHQANKFKNAKQPYIESSNRENTSGSIKGEERNG